MHATAERREPDQGDKDKGDARRAEPVERVQPVQTLELQNPIRDRTVDLPSHTAPRANHEDDNRRADRRHPCGDREHERRTGRLLPGRRRQWRSS